MTLLYHSLMNPKLRWRLFILIFLFLLAAFSGYIAFKERRVGEMTVAFLNIGQGDSIFIESPSGNQILIDGGPDRSVLQEISKVIPFYDRNIDLVLATHPDADHIGGLVDVLARYKVGLFMEPGTESDTSIYKELETRIQKINKIEARQGMVVDLGSGAMLEILFPVLDPRGMETNNSSIVARLVYGESEFLLTGDSPLNIEDYLVNSGVDLDSDVLKAGHHGSKTSTSETFVKAVDPEYAVISAGKDNRYGHPHQEVLNILEKNNVKVLNTATEGRIIFKTDGVNLKVK